MKICKTFFLISISFFLFSCATLNQKQINLAQANTDLGFYYLNHGNMVLAKEKLLLAIQENPKSPEANDAMGYFLEKVGDFTVAENYYLRAIQFGENKGAYQNNYGTYLYRQHRYDEAIKVFVFATEDPSYLSSGNAYKNAGLAALKLGNKEQARVFFAKATMNDPGIKVP